MEFAHALVQQTRHQSLVLPASHLASHQQAQFLHALDHQLLQAVAEGLAPQLASFLEQPLLEPARHDRGRKRL